MNTNAWSKFIAAGLPAFVLACAAQAVPGPIVITLGGDNDAKADAVITVDGLPYVAGTEIRDTVFPTQHCVRVSGPGVRVQRWNALFKYCRFPQMDDVMWIMGSADPNVTVTHTAYVTKNVRYVSPSGRDAEDAGQRADDPYKTLEYAAQQAPDICVLECAPGDYNEGEYLNGTERNRVYDHGKKLLFRGAGIGQSVLWGALDSTNPGDGRGLDAVRCAYFSSNNHSAIQGFTVRDGRCVSTGTDSVGTTRGGAGYNVNFVDCLITNCAAWRGQVVYHGSLTRCTVIGHGVANTAGGRTFEGPCSVQSCAIFEAAANNVLPSQTYEAPLIHCTVYPGTGMTQGSLVADASIFTNCVSRASGAFSTSARTQTAGCVWKWSRMDFNPEKQFVSDCTDADPAVVDWEGHDIRLKATSPALGAGVLPDDYYKIYCTDLNGNPIVFRNGRPTAGAVQDVVACVSVTAMTDIGTVHPTGDIVLEPGESVTVSLQDQTRPLAGFTVNDAFVEGQAYTYTAPASGSVPAPVVVSGVVRGTKWYVNANQAQDGDGFTRETAKKTFADLFACDVRAGDIINVAEGDYDDKTMNQPSAADTIRCRVAIPAGVTLQAEGAQGKTRIIGASATVEDSPTDYPGCGEDAIRCVWMGEGARLKGFTLAGGRTQSVCVEGGQDKTSSREKCYGGGLLAKNGAIIEDCFFTNNVSRRGSATTGGRFLRCVFIGNGGSHGVVQDWTNYPLVGLQNCYLDYFNPYIDVAAPFVNCFIGDRTCSGGERTDGIATTAGRVLRNTICLAKIRNRAATTCIITNCVCTGFSGAAAAIPLISNAGFGGVWAKADIKAGLGGADYRYTGLSGVDSPYVDAGGTDDWDPAGEKDLVGSQRVYNRAIDVGPWEWDWRGAYGAAVGAGITVTQASPTVGFDAQGRLELRDGETVEMSCCVGDSGKRHVPVSVTGEGTLKVSVNGGDARTLTAGEKEWSYRSQLATDVLSYAFDGEGRALLTGGPSTRGFMILFR